MSKLVSECVWWGVSAVDQWMFITNAEVKLSLIY